MADTIHVQDATARQLSVLLNLTPDEAQQVIAARPFATVEEFHRALPARVAKTKPGLDIPKLDINRTSANDLVRLAAIPLEAARAIQANRPYYFMIELRHLMEVDASVFDQLMQFFTVTRFTYTDKLTGQPIQLKPQPSQVLVSFREGEAGSVEAMASRLNLLPTHGQSVQSSYRIYSVPDTETGTSVLAELKRQPNIDQVIPSFQDLDGSRRYIDPRYCVVQFNADVPEQRQMEIITGLGLQIRERHRTPGLVTLEIPGGDDPGVLFRVITSLNNASEVAFAEPGYVGLNDLEGTDAGTRTPAEVLWNLALIRAQEAWVYGSGSDNVIIGVIDTGIDASHPALRDAILPRAPSDDWNFDEDGDGTPSDSEGHGTFISGLLVGNGELSVRGLCPGCRLLPLKVPLRGTSMSYTRRRDAILYALNYVKPPKRLILNLSWKTTGDVALIRDAINAATANNVIVVASAGNWPEQADEPHYPSDYQTVISVGGVGPDRKRAPYSFYGAQVDLAAPGGSGVVGSTEGNIRSAAPMYATRTDFGTSFATPHVAGLAALILSHDSTLSVTQVRQIIESTAVPIPGAGLGYGLIDAAAAVARVRGQPTQPNIPTPSGSHPATSSGLDAVNHDDLETLVLRFGLARITARLLIARRPFARVEDVRGTLGLTDEQYTRIAGNAQVPNPESDSASGTTCPQPSPNEGKLDVNRSTPY